jgi:hypothetical protein
VSAGIFDQHRADRVMASANIGIAMLVILASIDLHRLAPASVAAPTLLHEALYDMAMSAPKPAQTRCIR